MPEHPVSGQPAPGHTVRPDKLVVVAGTGTEVGKTWVATMLLESLAAEGLRCSARKPAQSFDPQDTTTDADELASATGEDPRVVCPSHRNYETPMAPPMAADALGRAPIAMADLVQEVCGSWQAPAPRVALVELAGGVRSPQAHDGDGRDFIAALAPQDVVLVANAGLGTINAVLGSLDSLDSLGGLADPGEDPTTRVLVHLNRYDDSDDLHRRNRSWLEAVGVPTLTTDVNSLVALVRERVS